MLVCLVLGLAQFFWTTWLVLAMKKVCFIVISTATPLVSMTVCTRRMWGSHAEVFNVHAVIESLLCYYNVHLIVQILTSAQLIMVVVNTPALTLLAFPTTIALVSLATL